VPAGARQRRSGAGRYGPFTAAPPDALRSKQRPEAGCLATGIPRRPRAHATPPHDPASCPQVRGNCAPGHATSCATCEVNAPRNATSCPQLRGNGAPGQAATVRSQPRRPMRSGASCARRPVASQPAFRAARELTQPRHTTQRRARSCEATALRGRPRRAPKCGVNAPGHASVVPAVARQLRSGAGDVVCDVRGERSTQRSVVPAVARQLRPEARHVVRRAARHPRSAGRTRGDPHRPAAPVVSACRWAFFAGNSTTTTAPASGS
jgi:hypothetical protein